MQRRISALTGKEFDLIVLGGGIFGIFVAWDAVLRGLSVALLERGDFAHATSANCFKMVHGGIRYLQHADIHRVRESSRERNAFLRIAPHLVRPLPIAIPTYGRGLQGREILSMGLLLYDLLTFDRNRGLADPQRRIPGGSRISKTDCLRLFPALEPDGLTGGVLFYDAQMYSPARLALATMRAAVTEGLEAANYLEAVGLLENGNRVVGVTARDTLTGDQIEIRGRVVVNAAGPWAQYVLKQFHGLQLRRGLTFSRDAAFVVRRRLFGNYGLAVQGATKDPDAVLSRGHRHLFIVPWRDHTMIGVWHVVHQGDPDRLSVTESDFNGFIDEVNGACPGLNLTLGDVSLWNAGLTLFGDNAPGAVDLSYGKRSLMVDHAKEHGVDGLITLVGVRYTTARGVAEKAVELAFQKLGRRPPPCRTRFTPVYGGQIQSIDSLMRDARGQSPAAINGTITALVQNHGSAFGEVLAYARESPVWAEALGATDVIKAEVVHAVREEMAQTLGDVVFRRTDLGTAGHPGVDVLETCAAIMASELGWTERRRKDEVERVEAAFPIFAAANVKPETDVVFNLQGGRDS